MKLEIKPSDLYYRYPRRKENRDVPKFAGTPDPHPFDRNDLYEVIPMFAAVMEALGTSDGRVLHRMEEILDKELPAFVESREAVFDCLLGALREELGG